MKHRSLRTYSSHSITSMTSSSPTIEKVDQNCYLIRNALDQKEQSEIFQEILDQSQHTDNKPKACMNPSPKTIIFDGNRSTLQFDLDNNSPAIFNQFIQSMKKILFHENSGCEAMMKEGVKQCNHLSMGAIRYKAPDGSFPDHVDHCSSFVFLLSLGCTSNFAVRGPLLLEEEKYQVFRFHSGDVIIFDASSKANISHGVRNIISESCPSELGEIFPSMQNHRFGIQCRVKQKNKAT